MKSLIYIEGKEKVDFSSFQKKVENPSTSQLLGGSSIIRKKGWGLYMYLPEYTTINNPSYILLGKNCLNTFWEFRGQTCSSSEMASM